jgi:zinc protease
MPTKVPPGRRWIVFAIVFIASLAPVHGKAHAQSRAELERIIQRRVLDNGMEVVVVESHGVPIATIEINVRNGAFTQPPEYAGLAHLYEHMFFKASRGFPRPDMFIDRASELGAIFNASTREENVNYYMTLSADSLEGGMQLMASALREPLFLREELERERQVVLGEYDRNESSPFFRLSREMDRLLYPGNFSRKNTIGDRDVIATTTPEKMRAIQKLYYVPNNSVLIVAGDVDPAKVFRLAQQMFGDWARGPDPFKVAPIPSIPPIEKSQAVIVEEPVGAVTILLQWQGPSVGRDPGATYAADVFSDALNSPTSGFQRRLVDSGLWQAILVNYYTLNHVGPITISGQVAPENFRQAMAALKEEIRKFDTPGYISTAELEDVKAQRAVSSAFGIEKASSITHTIGFWWSVASLDYFMGYVDNMATQRLDDLRSYARRYIVGKPYIAGVLISPSARQRIRLTEADLLAAPVSQ